MEPVATTIPAVCDVLRQFSDLLTDPPEPVFVEYEELLRLWENVRSSSDFSMQSLLRFVAKYSIDTKSPFFLSKLYGGADSLSLFADMLISYYNTNVHVYSTSPVFTLAEKLMIQRISRLLSSEEYGSGLFLPGGSYCNAIGLIAARHAHNALTKCSGNGLVPLSIIASHRCHYSIDKAAIMMGIGLSNLIKIDFDTINSNELEAIIVEKNVFCIVSTFGTTSEGVLESVHNWEALLSHYNVWHHVDAAIGGVLLYVDSPHTSHLAKADSITIDFHKLANISVQCSALMIHKRHEHVLHEVTSVNADYLFHSFESNGESIDIAAMSFQCGRRGDAFRLFVVDNMCDMKERISDFINRVQNFKDIVKNDKRYSLHSTEGHDTVTHVMFTPSNLLAYNVGRITTLIAHIVKNLRSENIFVEYNSTYFRIVPVNPSFHEEQMKHLLDRIYHWSGKLTV